MTPETTLVCINTHDQLLAARKAGLPDVAIVPRHLPSSSRNGSPYRNGWKVYRPGYNISGPEGADRGPYHYDANCRVFGEPMSLPWQAARKQALIDAMTWASTRYGVRNWKRNREGDYVDGRVHAQFPLKPRAKVPSVP